jgi:hypothetical protein
MNLSTNDNDPLAPVVAKLEEIAALYEQVEKLTKAVELHGRATMAACQAALLSDETAKGCQPEQVS